MKKIIFALALLFVLGCGHPPSEEAKAEYEKRFTRVTVVVQKKDWVQLTEGGFTSTRRQQVVITDTAGNEYRFAVNDSDMSHYNKLLVGKKYVVKSYIGHLEGVEELP